MATPLGHSLMGVAIFIATVRSSEWLLRWGWLFAVVLFSAGADLDYIPALFGRLDLAEVYHRGMSHTLLFAVAGTGLYMLVARVQKTRGIRSNAAVLFAAALVHLIIDIFTHDGKPPYGIAPFRPFSSLHLYGRWPVFPRIHKSTYSELFSYQTWKVALFEILCLGMIIAVIAVTRLTIERKRSRNGSA